MLRACLLSLALWSLLPAQGPQPPAPVPTAPLQGSPGDLMILPTRVVLEGRERAAEVTLRNEGVSKATYRIFLKEMDMTPEGKLVDRERREGETTAADLFRYTPRQVDLGPGEIQKIRIQLRKPEGLPDGEYRSHMVFQGIPQAEIPNAGPDAGDKTLSFKIQPIYGISIPVIIRHGDLKAQVRIEGLTTWLPPEKDMPLIVEFQLTRSGNRSSLSDIEVIAEAGGPVKPGTSLYQYKGVAVYNGLEARRVRIPLIGGKEGALKGTRLKVVVTPRDQSHSPSEASVTVS